MNELILAILLLLHLIFGWRTQMMIHKTVMLNPFQKRINSILNWFIPFLWGFLIRNTIKPSEVDVVTKANRKNRKGKNSDNWKDLTGYGGGSGNFDS